VTIFQILGVAVAALFAATSVRAQARGQVGGRSGMAWLALWTAVALAIAFPGTTVVVARALGISRGADLVFYCAILGMLVGFFLVYVRLRRIERNITVLVQQLALADLPGLEKTDRPDGTRDLRPLA
jgi:hypothetical protein